MAYVDAYLLLSDSQAVTADAYSTNTVDIEDLRSIGDGEPLVAAFVVEVAADFTTGDETYSFLFVQSANANLSSHDTLVTVTRTAAQLTAGTAFALDIPISHVTKRYVGVRYDVGGTTPTITCSAFITPRKLFAQNYKAYAKGYTV